MTQPAHIPAEELAAHVTALAAQLGETDRIALQQLRRLIMVLGVEKVQALVQQAQEIEAGDGMMLSDGSRRRTLGGVFFALARKAAPSQQRGFIWGYPKTAKRTKPATPASADSQEVIKNPTE